MAEIEYILYTHSDASITTVNLFLNSELSLVKGMSKKEFLAYKSLGISNLERIYNKYSFLDKFSYKTKYQAGDLDPLYLGTILAIPKSNLNKELISIMGKNQVTQYKKCTTFLADKLKELQADPEYTPVLSRTIDSFSTLKESIPEISVWIWIRSLDKILDVTPFIENVQINVGEDGGNFSLGLAPTTVGTMIYFNDGFVSSGLLHKVKNREIKRSDFFFHKYLQANDLVFIQYETLKIEKERISILENAPLLKNRLPGRIYDMIGLIDNNSISSEFQTNNVKINISGRDLIKLFQEDGSYYFPVTLTLNMHSNQDVNEPIIQRTIANGGTYDLLVTKGFRTIKSSLEFVINILSNIEIVPKDLFDFYGDRRSQRYILDNDKNLTSSPANGIWQIVEMTIDEEISKRVLADDSLSMPDGDLHDQLIKLCQKPFVEYLADTYGDKWSLTIRRPPFNKQAILDYLDNGLVIDINESDIYTENLSWNTEHIYSWYRIDFKSLLIAANSETLGDLIPAIFLPEYAKIWGNKKFEVVNMYIPTTTLSGSEKVKNENYIFEQAFEDYLFVIESNLYMPFTRQGTITIVGDRRIKRGTFIRHKGTDEIFYVNTVSNSFSISENQVDRTTTLGVIRGMKEKYIKGVSTSILTDGGYRAQKVGYFEIVNLSLIKKNFYNRLREKKSGDNDVQLYTEVALNQDIFNFFLQRKQFDE